MKTTLAISIAGIYLILVSTGCSVFMALAGHPEPNFEAFEVGSTRKQVEIQLGFPVVSRSLPDGKREDTYRFEMGNSPNGHRATLYLWYDVFTLGIAEIFFTPIELYQGNDEETLVVYGPDDRVLEIRGYRPPPPSAELKASEEAQKQFKKQASPQSTDQSTGTPSQ